MNKLIGLFRNQVNDILYLNDSRKEDRYKIAFALLAISAFIIACRISSVWFTYEVYTDEEAILIHISSILATGHDMFGNYLPLFPKVGTGLTTYVYLYPMVAYCYLFGVTAVRIRFLQQILTIAACFFVAVGIKLWTDDRKMFWITFFTALTLPWGFLQANKIWDPCFVPVYFSVYFLFFSMLMNDKNLTSAKKYIYSAVAFAFLVLLAIVYPAVRIPAVAMWIYSLVWAIKKQRISTPHIITVFIVSSLTALPLAINMLNPEFNARAQRLMVFDLESEDPLYFQLYQYMRNFVKLFNPEFLFFAGDNVYRHSLPIFGMLGTVSIIPLVELIRKRKYSPILKYAFFIIIVNSLGVALTNDYQPHGLRSCLSWVPFAILIADGWHELLKTKDKKQHIIWTAVFLAFFAVYYLFYIMINRGIIYLYL